MFHEIEVRLYGINAPEIRGASHEAGLSARSFLVSLLSTESGIFSFPITIKSHKPKDPLEKYGRWLAEVYLPDGRNVSEEMIKAGQAVRYDP